MEEYIESVLKDAGIAADIVMTKSCAFFLDELWEANKKINLTAAKTIEELVQKHLLDSLYLTKLLQSRGQSFLDLGTGGGFPGVPLKFFYEESPFYFLDASRKKVNFLKYTLNKMGVKKFFCIQGRAEELGNKDGYKGAFDVVCCRAVAEAKSLITLGMPFLKESGLLVLYKGPGGEKELSSAESLIAFYGGKLEEPFDYTLPGGEKRTIFTICVTAGKG